jgi:nucleoside-diphosphate-sugar epimerase
MSPRRILITGGAGFIGTHLAEALCDDSELVLFDNFRRDSLSSLPTLSSHPHVTVMPGNVMDPGSLSRAFEGVDTVIHLAAIAGVSSYYAEPLNTLQVNILGTVNVLEEAARRGIGQLVHFSTSEVFGPNAMWVEEDSPHGIGPVSDSRWVYATSKLAGEHFCLRYAEKFGFPCTVIRPFNVYGPRQVGEGAISNFCRAVAARQPLMVYGDGAAIRAWCYISDLVAAVKAVLSTPVEGNQVFNIGNPKEVETTLGLARRFLRLAPGATIQYRAVPRQEVRARIPVIDKARRLLGFEPKVDLDMGISLTLKWFEAQEGQQP